MLRQIAQSDRQCIPGELDVGIEHQVIVRVTTVHDQVMRCAVADIRMAVKVVHGHCGTFEVSGAELYDRFRGRAFTGVIDEHQVYGSQQLILGGHGDRLRKLAQCRIEQRKIRAIRDDADRQRWSGHVQGALV